MKQTYDKLREIQGFILDFDGTTYLSNRALPGAIEFVNLLREQRKRHIWVTNNCYKTADDYAQKLCALGFNATSDDIFTSGELAINYLLQQKASPRIYPLAPRRFEEEMQACRITLTDDHPDFVLVSIDLGLTYEKLKRACLLIRQGVPYIGTHPDLAWPTEEGYLPDCGALLAAVEAATGKPPLAVLGKPHPLMAEGALRKLGVAKENAAMIGDRLYTDIKMGIDAGLTSILVLTGETKPAHLEASDIKPDFVFNSLVDLVNVIQ